VGRLRNIKCSLGLGFGSFIMIDPFGSDTIYLSLYDENTFNSTLFSFNIKDI
jgi:hypothetical protein